MKSVRIKQLKEGMEQHKNVIKNWDQEKGDRELAFLMLSKSFEILVESGWKVLTFQVENEGLEAPSPKDAVRKAAKIGLIDDPKTWIDCINARKDSVHNYFGISKDKFIALSKHFLQLSQKLLKNIESK